MKLKLDKNTRKFIEVEIELEDGVHQLKYFEKNTKQLKALKKLSRTDDVKMVAVDDLIEKQFFENLQGDSKVIKSIINFYEEDGNIYDFINMCDEELGKLKKKG